MGHLLKQAVNRPKKYVPKNKKQKKLRMSKGTLSKTASLTKDQGKEGNDLRYCGIAPEGDTMVRRYTLWSRDAPVAETCNKSNSGILSEPPRAEKLSQQGYHGRRPYGP